MKNLHTDAGGAPGASTPLRLPIWLGFGAFLAVALFFLWEEHRAHILGVLPYSLLGLCLLMHFFMHRGHGAHGGGAPGHDADPRHRHEGGPS